MENASSATLLHHNNHHRYHHLARMRDPGGVTSTSVDVASGQEPAGVPPPPDFSPLAAKIPSYGSSGTGGAPPPPPPPPTPARRDGASLALPVYNSGVTNNATPVLAFLANLPPPPPPPNAPPPRKRRSKSASTPRGTESSSSTAPSPSQTTVADRLRSQDASLADCALTSPRLFSNLNNENESNGKRAQNRRVALDLFPAPQAHSPEIAPRDTAGALAVSGNRKRDEIVQERIRAALAIYNQTDIAPTATSVLDMDNATMALRPNYTRDTVSNESDISRHQSTAGRRRNRDPPTHEEDKVKERSQAPTPKKHEQPPTEWNLRAGTFYAADVNMADSHHKSSSSPRLSTPDSQKRDDNPRLNQELPHVSHERTPFIAESRQSFVSTTTIGMPDYSLATKRDIPPSPMSDATAPMSNNATAIAAYLALATGHLASTLPPPSIPIHVFSPEEAPLPPSRRSAATAASVSTASNSQYMTANSHYPTGVSHQSRSVPGTGSGTASVSHVRTRPKTPERKVGREGRTTDRERGRRRNKTPQSNRRRNKTPDGRKDTSSVVSSANTSRSSQQYQEEKKAGGFLRKIFGVRRKNKGRRDGKGGADTVHMIASSESSEENKTIGSLHAQSTISSKTGLLSIKSPKSKRSTELSAHYGATHEIFLEESGPEETLDTTGASSDERLEEMTAVERDRPDVFFAQDEVSTLTAPTVESNYRRQDPTEKTDNSSDPVGHYWDKLVAVERQDETAPRKSPTVDPFTAPFFDEPVAASPMTTKMSGSKKIGPSLKVIVASAHDPVGESPLNSVRRTRADEHGHLMHDPSPRGYTTPSFLDHPFQDPVGESPLHKNERGPSALRDGSLYAPDPPLYFTSDFQQSDGFSLEDIGEEKKSDDLDLPMDLSSYRTNFVNILSPPPPPPPPPPSSASPRKRASPKNGMTQQQAITDDAPTPRTRVGNDELRSFGPSDSYSSPVRGGDSRIEAASFRNRSTSPRHAKPTREVLRIPRSPRRGSHSSPGRQMKVKETSQPFSSDLARSEGTQSPTPVSPTAAGSRSSSTIKKSVSAKKEDDDVSRATTGKNDAETDASSKSTASPRSKFITSKKKATSPRNDKGPELPKGDGPKASSASHELDVSNPGFTISMAAQMNAKTVAYIHSINGQPSPRRIWRRVHSSDSDVSPAATPKERSIVSPKADQVISSVSSPTNKTNISEDGGEIMRLFAAYSNKFKGRKPQKAGCSANAEYTSLPTQVKTVALEVRSTEDKDAGSSESSIGSVALRKHVLVTALTVSMGLKQLRNKREESISHGKAKRVIPEKKGKVPKVQSFFGPSDVYESKDPIHRAGRRLLSKAAVPIQAGCRRYLAQREAVDRMWALIEIQSYMRRWRAEATLVASRFAVTTIQKVFRGSRVRGELRRQLVAVIHVQRVVRGYLAALRIYDEVYSIILIQARVRGFVARQNVRRYKAYLLLRCVCSIQTWYRARTCFNKYRRYISARKIQSWYRSLLEQAKYKAYMSARKVQTWYRSRLAQAQYKEYKSARKIQTWYRSRWAQSQYMEYKSARKVQTWYRSRSAQVQYKEYTAARKVQSWYRSRSAHGKYKDLRAAIKIQSWCRGKFARIKYQFDIVDIIIVQGVMRRWLAYRRSSDLSRERQAKRAVMENESAIKIQAVWRGFQGYTDYIFSLVDILVVQKTIRRWLAKHRARVLRIVRNRQTSAIKIQSQLRRYKAQMKMLYELVHIIMVQSMARKYLAGLRKNRLVERKKLRDISATKIQAIWRGFWAFSHYVILQYEASCLQAWTRGMLAREKYKLKLGCTIMIQSVARRFLANNACTEIRAQKAMTLAAIEAMRETVSCKRIQFWWRVVLDCRKEKAAALVIERFFLQVKVEVDREIRRVQEKKNVQRAKKKLEADDKLLEKVWLNTVDDAAAYVDVFAFSPSNSTLNSQQQRSPTNKSTRPDPSGTPRSTRSSSNKRTPKNERGSVTHRASSPPMNLVMRHEYEGISPRTQHISDSLSLTYSKDTCDLSGLTSITGMTSTHRLNSFPHMYKTMAELSDELSLEGALFDATSSHDDDEEDDGEEGLAKAIKTATTTSATTAATSSSATVEKYRKMYGLQSAPSRTAQVHHFFADDLESVASTVMSPRFSRRLKSGLLTPPPQGTSISPNAGTNNNNTSVIITPTIQSKTPTGRGSQLAAAAPAAAAALYSPHSVGSAKKSGGGNVGGRLSSIGSDSSPLSAKRHHHLRGSSNSSNRNSKASPHRSSSNSSRSAGKVLVMNPYPDYKTSSNNQFMDDDEPLDLEYMGEEFGMI